MGQAFHRLVSEHMETFDRQASKVVSVPNPTIERTSAEPIVR